MAFTNTPANVQAPGLAAVALKAPGADFTGGLEIGMSKPKKFTATPIPVTMNTGNDLTDGVKILIEGDTLQNSIADFGRAHAFAATYVQAVVKSHAGQFGNFTGADSDSETLLGLMYDFQFKQNDSFLKLSLMGEMGLTAYKAAWAASTTGTWTAGVDATDRRRPGVKSVKIGGAHVGALKAVDGSFKSKSQIVQLGRPLLLGTECNVKVVLAQTAKADVDAAIDAMNGSDTVIIEWWNGDIAKFTGLLAGKAATFEVGAEENLLTIDIKVFIPKGSTRIDYTTDAAILDFIYLDNVAS